MDYMEEKDVKGAEGLGGKFFFCEVLYKETKQKNRFLQANSSRYFLRLASNAPLTVLVEIYRNNRPGTQPWSPESGELEGEAPQVLDLPAEQTTVQLKIGRNSFQDKEGIKRSRGQVSCLADLYQFQLLLKEAHTKVTLWRSDPFYVLSCSKKAAKEWFDCCCAQVAPSGFPRKKRMLDHSDMEVENKFIHLFVAGAGPITPIVLQADMNLSKLRGAIAMQALPVPLQYSFLHPNFSVVEATAASPASLQYQVVTKPQEEIISTKDFREQKIVLVPAAVISAELIQKSPSQPLQSQTEDQWTHFLEIAHGLGLAPIMNLNSSEKFGTLSLFFEDMCNRWGSEEAIKYFVENIQSILQHQFHGILTKEELNGTLQGKDPGSYCFRFSLTQKCSLVVSYVSEERQILSIPMELLVAEKPFKWRIFNPLTNQDDLFDNVSSYLQLITVVASKPLLYFPDAPRDKKDTQNKEIYSDHKQQMHMSFWVKKFLSIN